jgi:alanyl-tRNA synthetase
MSGPKGWTPQPLSSDEIRETYLEFFAQRGHLRQPSYSLIPAATDTSALLTVAGMHPLKPFFLGVESPPAKRMTSCQKVFRTVDLDIVGSTTRHLTFFEMLGNFSFGDYFKEEAIAYGLELSRDGFGIAQERIWVTVFAGDDELGLGPDEEAIAAWEAVGIPRERIVLCNRKENFWESGPTGPCGPCSELYLDRGLDFGAPDDLPGGENERFLEYWNLVFMAYDQNPPNALTPLPARNIDTGLGLNRMASILQDVASVFETDQFAPLIALGEELSGKRYGAEKLTDRSLRVLADHARGMVFLIADGVVPSNEDRGYVLRRVMRRAIQHGRALGLEPGFLLRYGELVREIMGAAYPELTAQREAIDTWLPAEEEHFGHTLDQGLATLDELIARARDDGGTVSGEDAFRLHDTFGFPFELTRELVAEAGLTVDEAGFDERMTEQRARSRSGSGALAVSGDTRAHAGQFAAQAGFKTRFTGYETTSQATTVGAVTAQNGSVLVKLADSPFYPVGGGQVADHGVIECEHGECRARVEDVVRLGDDQALVAVLERGELRPGERVVALVDPLARHATECNHTATHLLHAALRQRLGPHVRQAGSYVGPDKLRFDFSHGAALSAGELRDVEDQINRWILENHSVRGLITTLEEARRLGAMALFGEKYGEVVRMVEVGEGEFSRELCGGTHVRSTAEIALCKITSETSSAANVRRIEALTGPEAVAHMRDRDQVVDELATIYRTRPEEVVEAARAREAERQVSARRGKRAEGFDASLIAADARLVAGIPVIAARVECDDARLLPELADRVRGQLAEAGVVILGTVVAERASVLVSVAPAVAERGVRAGDVAKAAAEVLGGGGGGRDTLAQAGGANVGKIDEALVAAEAAVHASLSA